MKKCSVTMLLNGHMTHDAKFTLSTVVLGLFVHLIIFKTILNHSLAKLDWL